MDCIQLVQDKGTGAGVFLNVVLKVTAGNFLTNLATVSVQWSSCTTANCTVVMLFGLTASSLCPPFPLSRHSSVAVNATATASKGSMFLQVHKNLSVEDLVGDGDA